MKLQYLCFLYSILSFPLLSVSADDKWRLIYSANFQSELKPCGCSIEGNLGGVARRATKFNELRKSKIDTLFVSAGDVLGDNNEQGAIKARYMLQAVNMLKLDAILPGERDLNHPATLLGKYKLPWVLSNSNNTLFSPYIEYKFPSNKRVIIFGLLDPALVSQAKRSLLLDPKQALLSTMVKAKVNPTDTVILLVHGSVQFVKNFHKKIPGSSHIDVIVRGHLHNKSPDKVAAKKLISHSQTPILATGHRGQEFGVAILQSKTATRLISNRVIKLPSNVKDHPAFTKLYAQYNKSITKWYRKKTVNIKIDNSKQSPYVNSMVCGTCHINTYKTWKKSRHANAISSLKKVNKHHDPECLRCHTTGMGKPGGFVSIKATPKSLNVQCESCHGQGRKHSQYPLSNRMKKAFTQCTSCHSSENSPKFQKFKYWAKIIHTKEVSLPLHVQSISKIKGIYDLIDSQNKIVTNKNIIITEFFNFYCKRCYVFNASWLQLRAQLDKSKVKYIHKQIPIIFGNKQKPWASIAYLVAADAGYGQRMKSALFKEKFENNSDINNKATIIKIAKSMNLEDKVKRALADKTNKVWRILKRGQSRKKKSLVYSTPTVIINKKLRLLPKHTSGNTNLFVENLTTVLLDIHCRMSGVCQN